LKFSFTVFRNSIYGIATQIAIKLLSFTFSVLIIRRLGADSYGQYVAVQAFGAIFSIFSDLGLGPYAVRQFARWRDASDGLEQAKRLYGNILALRLILALLTVILVTAFAWITHRPLFLILAIFINSTVLILYGIQGSSDAVLTGMERLDISSKAKVLNQLIFISIGAVVIWIGLGYIGLIIANIIGVAALTYVCWRSTRRLGLIPTAPVLSSWLPLLRASLPFAFIGFALGLSYKFDSVLLNIFRTNTETGYYNAAYNLIFSLLFFSNAFNIALYPSLTRQAVTAPQKLPQIYARSIRYLLLLSIPIAIGTTILAKNITLFLYGAAYSPVVPALQILIWVLPLMFASEFLGYIVVIANKEKLVARAIMISTGFNVIVNLIVVPRYGYLAAAVMTVLTEAVLVSQYLYTLRQTIRQIDWVTSLLKPLLSAVIMGLMILLINTHIPLLVTVGVSVLLYTSLLFVFRVLGKEELNFLLRLQQYSRDNIN
jgi:O-antigen/teichoic acid export membrane protein